MKGFAGTITSFKNRFLNQIFKYVLFDGFFDKPIGFFISENINLAMNKKEEKVDTLSLLLRKVRLYIDNNVVIFGGSLQGFQKIIDNMNTDQVFAV